jgi:hypothetical protein
LKQILETDKIRKLKSYIAATILFVSNVNSQGLYLNIDYREINEIIIADSYLRLIITDLCDYIKESQIFTILDPYNGYSLIKGTEGDE